MNVPQQRDGLGPIVGPVPLETFTCGIPFPFQNSTSNTIEVRWAQPEPISPGLRMSPIGLGLRIYTSLWALGELGFKYSFYFFFIK